MRRLAGILPWLLAGPSLLATPFLLARVLCGLFPLGADVLLQSLWFLLPFAVAISGLYLSLVTPESVLEGRPWAKRLLVTSLLVGILLAVPLSGAALLLFHASPSIRHAGLLFLLAGPLPVLFIRLRTLVFKPPSPSPSPRLAILKGGKPGSPP